MESDFQAAGYVGWVGNLNPSSYTCLMLLLGH